MITRNNYEEFFLLYVDNELSPADREGVERFIDEHPDLKEELEVLLQCKISHDEMPGFPGKEQLLRFEAPIHAGNYEEWFLSYIDNELDAPSRQAVIDFIRQHPEKNIELQQLQRTISTPDPDIVFPDKASLYRREPARTRKIAWLPFARIAAAALVLGAAGLLVFHPFRTGESVATAKPPGKKFATTTHPGQISGTTTHPGSDSSMTANPVSAPAPVLASAPSSAEKKRTPPVTSRRPDPYYIQKKEDKRSLPSGDDPAPLVMAKTDPARPLNVDPVSTAKTVATGPIHDMAVTVPATIDRNMKAPVTLTTAGDQAQHEATGNMNASFATQALLSQVSYQDDDSREETASPRKNKLRGIFRKVTRVLEKPAAREDDDNKKVTIGGFQFALK
jgi:hypothetical protein